MNPFTIRPYEDQDLPGVKQLWKIVFPESPPWNQPEDDIRRKLQVQPELFLVASLNDIIIGSAMGGFDGHRGWVYYVAVHPDHQKNDLGSQLMKYVEKGLISAGCTKLNLQVRSTNEGVIAFYKKLGYTIEDRISMSKRLV